MHEREHYEWLMGLSAPWFVADVKLDTEAQQVDVFVEHAGGTSFCWLFTEFRGTAASLRGTLVG